VPDRGGIGERGRLLAWAGVRAWSGVVPALSIGPSLGLDYVRGAWSLGSTRSSSLRETSASSAASERCP